MSTAGYASTYSWPAGANITCRMRLSSVPAATVTHCLFWSLSSTLDTAPRVMPIAAANSPGVIAGWS
ncbi:MAG: hypothetical protein U0X20_03355 [Caldilineaceae bacterium]